MFFRPSYGFGSFLRWARIRYGSNAIGEHKSAEEISTTGRKPESQILETFGNGFGELSGNFVRPLFRIGDADENAVAILSESKF